MKRVLAMGSIQNGVRSLLVVRHEDEGRIRTTLQVDRLPERRDEPELPPFLARREVSHR